MPLIVLTGYNGLLGSALLRQLAGAHQVLCLGRTQPPRLAGVTYADVDLARSDLTEILPERADAVVHLAQSDGFNRFPEIAEQVFAVNVASVSQLLSWSRRAGVTHFVHASTGGLYGNGPDAFRETDPVRIEGALSHYFATKRCAELLAETYSKFFHVVALRYFFIYGRGQKRDMLIPRLIESVRNGRPIMLAGSDGIKISPIHVDDAAAATAKALTLQRGAVINVAGSEQLSLRTICNAIGDALRAEAVFEMVPTDSIGHVLGDTDLMHTLLTVPRLRFADVLPDLCR